VIYMLNLIFNATDRTAFQDGRFEADNGSTDPTQCLTRSKVWLQSTSASPNWDSPADWTVTQADSGNALSIKGGGTAPDQAVVRIQGLNTSPDSNGTWLVRLSAVIARNTPGALKDNSPGKKPYQNLASPFPLGMTTQPCVTYEFENMNYQPVAQGASSWVQPLGTATLTTTSFPNGKPANYHDAYSLVVAITAGQGAAGGQDGDPTNIRTYSHDPDMDVQC
jgi:hypothetical protein